MLDYVSIQLNIHHEVNNSNYYSTYYKNGLVKHSAISLSREVVRGTTVEINSHKPYIIDSITGELIGISGLLPDRLANEVVYSDSLTIHGNPSKWFNGHNLFGTDDFQILIPEFIIDVLNEAKIPIDSYTAQMIIKGEYEVSRVDINRNFKLTDSKTVNELLEDWVNVISKRNQNSFSYLKSDSGSRSISMGIGSNLIEVKIYNKYGEITDNLKKKNKKPFRDIPKVHYQQLLEYANGLLRVEFVLHREYLKKRGLTIGSAWKPDTVSKLFTQEVNMLRIPSNVKLHNKRQERLPGALQIPYLLWSKGCDLKELYPESSYHKFQSGLWIYDIDVTKKPKVWTPAKLKDLEVVGIPDWAEKNGLYRNPAGLNLPKGILFLRNDNIEAFENK